MDSDSLAAHENVGQSEAWQLRMFRRSLKKQQKMDALSAILGKLENQNCLLVTCGDNNGALNWKIRHNGGDWSWADGEATGVAQIGQLTGDPVSLMDRDYPQLAFPDNTFDIVVTVDVHEHLPAPEALNLELARVTKPGGRIIISTPNGDERKLAVRIKNLLGMTREIYGHIVIGFEVSELEAQMRRVGVSPSFSMTYSRFFTEMMELMINFAYVKILKKDRGLKVDGQIAPQTQDQLESVGVPYRLYTWVFPFLWLVSRMDRLIPFSSGYAVVVEGKKAT